MTQRNLIIGFALLLLASCASRVPFTNAVKTKYSLQDTDLKRLQFYLEGDITMFTGSKDGSTKTKDGELVISNEQNVDKTIIPDGVPCIVEKAEGDVLYVAFSGGTLKFASTTTEGRYVLQPDELVERRAKVEYGGKKYFLTPSSTSAYLIFKLKRKDINKSTSKVDKGKKL